MITLQKPEGTQTPNLLGTTAALVKEGADTPARPVWTKNDTLNLASPDALVVDCNCPPPPDPVIEQNRCKLDALFQTPEAAELRAGLHARRGGFFERAKRALSGRIIGVPITDEIALSKDDFYYVSESVNRRYLVIVPDEALADPELMDKVTAGFEKVLKEFRESGTLEVKKDFEDATHP